MSRLWIWSLVVAVALAQEDPVSQQIIDFRTKTRVPVGILTTSSGSAVDCNDTITLNSNLMRNEYFLDTITHFAREQIPSRIVHIKGTGAFGYFQVTHDVTDICKAKLFGEIGKKTSVAVRFSTAFTDKGGPDTRRLPFGFSVKFYTEDGNFDLLSFSTPMFPIKDPILFPNFIHALKPNPVTNLMDRNTIWDMFTLHPEALYTTIYTFGDNGIPDGYRRMPGFSIHTYQVYNIYGESYFVRFHMIPESGIKNLNSTEGARLAAEDPDYYSRDLYNAIANGTYVSWQVSVQVLSQQDIYKADFDVFDITRTLPLDKYPLRPVGVLVLNRNPENYFAEIEQIAFCPGNLVPGILGAPDKLFEAWILGYRDAQNYRLGVNHKEIAVNRPINYVSTYNRNGKAPVGDNMKGTPNYYPNTFNGPVTYIEGNRPQILQVYHDQPNNFDQVFELYEGMEEEERINVVTNLFESLKLASTEIRERAIKLFTIIHDDLGNRVAQAFISSST